MKARAESMKALLEEVHGIGIRMDGENTRVPNDGGWGKCESLQKSKMFQLVSLSYTHVPGKLEATPLLQIPVCHCSYTERNSDSIRNPGPNSAVNLQ